MNFISQKKLPSPSYDNMQSLISVDPRPLSKTTIIRLLSISQKSLFYKTQSIYWYPSNLLCNWHWTHIVRNMSAYFSVVVLCKRKQLPLCWWDHKVYYLLKNTTCNTCKGFFFVMGYSTVPPKSSRSFCQIIY